LISAPFQFDAIALVLPGKGVMLTLRRALREHRHFIIVVTLLTLVMTYPTIEYVFRTDVFALPTDHGVDVYVKLWDIWYSKQVITGKADRFYTHLIFYPEGVSLARHPLFLFYGIAVSAMQLLMPLSNAYNLAYLLGIFSCALAAYVYFRWLFTDTWIALFGAVVFGLCPHITNHTSWPEITWIAPLPLAVYCVHRGILEKRSFLILLGGLVAGLTAEVTMYFCVVVLLTLGLVLGGLAVSRWRESAFWRQALLALIAVALSSAPRLIPLLQDLAALEAVMQHYGAEDRSHDLMSFIVNLRHPTLGPLAEGIFPTLDRYLVGKTMYVGILPLMLIAIGLYGNASRRRMLPWLLLCLVFGTLALGSSLTVNGIRYDDIRLPKHYLNQMLPLVFEAFHFTSFFMPGVVLPLAILACFGLERLQRRYPAAARPGFILLLIALVAFEYYSPTPVAFADPITGNPVSKERLAFVDWLKQEEAQDIGLINLPFDRSNSKLYLFYQSLHGFPQTEGGISRPPDSAFDYYRANPVLSIWLEQHPTNCVIHGRDGYLAAMTQLAEDGFTHIIHHYGFYFWQRHIENFRYVEPAYRDDYVGIYRLDDMLKSCPG